MASSASPAATWWIWRPIQERLITFTLALLSPLREARYTVQLTPSGTGQCDFTRRLIQVNPTLFGAEATATQFRATQGLLAHEAGHALFTDAWPDADQAILGQLVNVLEDERMERCVRRFYPGIGPAFDLLGDLMLARQGALEVEARWQALACCLVWRWASSRRSELEMLKQLAVTTRGRKLWSAIRPQVEAAWAEPATGGVIVQARAILETLGIPLGAPPPRGAWSAVGVDSVPIRRAEPVVVSRPVGAQPGLGLTRAEDAPAVGEDEFLKPEPYGILEDAARPLARQLVDALQQPAPDVRLEPHAWRGRYTFRQEERTPETPCLFPQGAGRAPRSLALYGLVDRSGSMRSVEGAVQLALMTLYLAATELAVPIGLAAFGANRDTDDSKFVLPLTEHLSLRADEGVKALIAGYRGTTGNEFLDWGLRRAEAELRERPEALKLIIVVHDGQPVYHGDLGSDWSLSLRHLRQMEAAGLTPVGIYLGDDPDDLRQLRQLFRWLVVCEGAHLPDRLSDLLRSLLDTGVRA